MLPRQDLSDPRANEKATKPQANYILWQSHRPSANIDQDINSKYENSDLLGQLWTRFDEKPQKPAKCVSFIIYFYYNLMLGKVR